MPEPLSETGTHIHGAELLAEVERLRKRVHELEVFLGIPADTPVDSWEPRGVTVREAVQRLHEGGALDPPYTLRRLPKEGTS